MKVKLAQYCFDCRQIEICDETGICHKCMCHSVDPMCPVVEYRWNDSGRYEDINEEKEMKIWYLAHPVLSDEQYTVEENLEHVLVVQGILHKAGIFTVIPWFSWVTIYGAPTPDEVRKEMLNMDCVIIFTLKGRLILSGHKMAEGMSTEFDTALSCDDHEIRNLIGVPDKLIKYLFKENEMLL